MKTLKNIFLILLAIAGFVVLGIMENEDLEMEQQMAEATPCIVSKQNAGLKCEL